MDLNSLFDMGRHGEHVWAALAVTAGAMILLAGISLRGLRARQAEWDRLRTREDEVDEAEA